MPENGKKPCPQVGVLPAAVVIANIPSEADSQSAFG